MKRDERGFALLTVIMVMTMLMAVMLAYAVVTRVDQGVTGNAFNRTRGYYAAEAALNLRAEEIRQTFLDYRRPSGTAPADGIGNVPCAGSNQGNGDFVCRTDAFGGRAVVSFIKEMPGNPTSMVVPAGEPFENLNAQRYGYDVHSVASGPRGFPEAILDIEFSSRLVPLFQFAAFYNKDLEIHPGPPMTLAGPVHSNGDLYLGSGGGLDILGQVTTAGRLYQGRKTDTTCYAGGVRVPDPGTLRSLPACSGSALRQYVTADLTPWNGRIRDGVDVLMVPEPEEFDATPGSFYWDNADVRIALKLGVGPPSVELRRADGTVDAAGSTTLNGCGPALSRAVGISSTFYNLRESKSIQMLEINTERLLNCLNENNSLMGGKSLDDATGGGLVWYLTVDGPLSSTINGYGVRVSNGGELRATTGVPTPIRGLNIVSDQAVYVKGDFNATAKKPAAVMADSINVLSSAYGDGEHSLALSAAARQASTAVINAAFLAGTDVTGGVEGPGGQSGAYNGGLENYPRLHENWSGVTLTYRGSFVSLNAPRHVNGPHTTPNLYSPPNRNWGFDTDFNDAARLPPITPRFVYLRQDLFVRDFDR